MLAPFLVFGLLTVSRRVQPWIWILVLAVLLAIGLSEFLEAHPKKVFGYINITALHFYFFLAKQWHGFNPYWLVAVLSAVAMLWLVFSRISQIRFTPIALAFFLSISALLGFDLLFLHAKADQLATKDIVSYVRERMPKGTCVNHDVKSQRLTKLYLYKVMLYQYPLLKAEIEKGRDFWL